MEHLIRIRRTRIIAMVIGIALTALLGLTVSDACAAPVFVSATGSDLTGDGSADNPYASIQHAMFWAAWGMRFMSAPAFSTAASRCGKRCRS